MEYKAMRTETADAHIRKLILYVPENFGNEAALQKLEELEQNIADLGIHPYKGAEPRYPVLRRQGYRVLVLEKNLVFYKINEKEKKVVVYAVADQRQDYLNIIRGL